MELWELICIIFKGRKHLVITEVGQVIEATVTLNIIGNYINHSKELTIAF